MSARTGLFVLTDALRKKCVAFFVVCVCVCVCHGVLTCWTVSVLPDSVRAPAFLTQRNCCFHWGNGSVMRGVWGAMRGAEVLMEIVLAAMVLGCAGDVVGDAVGAAAAKLLSHITD